MDIPTELRTRQACAQSQAEIFVSFVIFTLSAKLAVSPTP